jgi:integrase
MEVFAMGNIRTRKESGKLFLDFRYQNRRCREQTSLNDVPANRKKLVMLLQKIEAEILLGSFDYAQYFPNSKMVQTLKRQSSVVASHHQTMPSFSSFSEDWYEEMQITWRESYRVTVRGVLDRRLVDYFGKKQVDLISKADLLQFRAQLAKVVSKNGKRFSPSHINRHMKILRMILNEAADRFDFSSAYRGIKPLKIPKADVDPFTLEEIDKILGAVRRDFRSYYTVRFFTGMRTGEIDGLKWSYVDFERRQILIRETVVRGKPEYTKTEDSQREISMSQPVYDALKQQQKATGKLDYVFCTRKGTPLQHNNVTKRVWKPLLKHIGLTLRTPYQSRHTAATLWLAAGENPEWIARQMGHANTEMLFRVYSRYVPNLTRQDGSAFERLLNEQFPTPEAHS